MTKDTALGEDLSDIRTVYKGRDHERERAKCKRESGNQTAPARRTPKQ